MDIYELVAVLGGSFCIALGTGQVSIKLFPFLAPGFGFKMFDSILTFGLRTGGNKSDKLKRSICCITGGQF